MKPGLVLTCLPHNSTQDCEVVELKTFCKEKAPDKVFRNDNQRRAWVKEKFKYDLEEDVCSHASVCLCLCAFIAIVCRRRWFCSPSTSNEVTHGDADLAKPSCSTQIPSHSLELLSLKFTVRMMLASCAFAFQRRRLVTRSCVGESRRRVRKCGR
jgi:hypothetical protein